MGICLVLEEGEKGEHKPVCHEGVKLEFFILDWDLQKSTCFFGSLL